MVYINNYVSKFFYFFNCLVKIYI